MPQSPVATLIPGFHACEYRYGKCKHQFAIDAPDVDPRLLTPISDTIISRIFSLSRCV
jgi:hypothetical protein